MTILVFHPGKNLMLLFIFLFSFCSFSQTELIDLLANKKNSSFVDKEMNYYEPCDLDSLDDFFNGQKNRYCKDFNGDGFDDLLVCKNVNLGYNYQFLLLTEGAEDLQRILVMPKISRIDCYYTPLDSNVFRIKIKADSQHVKLFLEDDIFLNGVYFSKNNSIKNIPEIDSFKIEFSSKNVIKNFILKQKEGKYTLESKSTGNTLIKNDIDLNAVINYSTKIDFKRLKFLRHSFIGKENIQIEIYYSDGTKLIVLDHFNFLSGESDYFSVELISLYYHLFGGFK